MTDSDVRQSAGPPAQAGRRATLSLRSSCGLWCGRGPFAGLGGGVARDVLLGLEPAAITMWYYVPAILAAAIIGGLTARQVSLSPLPFVAAQAVAVWGC